MTPVEVRVVHGPSESRVTVEGEVDLSNVAALREALDAETTGDRPLVVDLSAVSYIDSSGIAALFERASTARMEIVCPDRAAIRSVVEISRLSDVAAVRQG